MPAKRDQLCVVGRSHSSTAANMKTTQYCDFTLCQVAAITREGEAKELRTHVGSYTPLYRKDWETLFLIPDGFFDKQGAISALGLGKVFETIDAARRATALHRAAESDVTLPTLYRRARCGVEAPRG